MTERRVIMTDPKQNDYFYEEAIKTLRTNIQFTGTEVKSIVITSCYPNEGKSDVVFQLALEIGKMGKKVLVLDADIRKSSYISRFQVKQKTAGLSQYLSGQSGLQDIVYSTNFRDVDIIFAGPSAPNPSELLAQESFASLVHTMRGKYDYVLVDTPPVGSLTDAAVVARQCDGAILVVESDLVSRRVALKVKQQLEMSGCHILGAVLNKVDIKKNKYYSKYSYYYGEEK
ncbi:CpsD/CapB family tyrosine-protein kinase [Lachnoclostridium sp. An76]|uniref:CpsD/CapB family tyrosine-protein kinase n=1 Tax=Lachnoclostridium sp. An76 TaxID=1965654 RepID=UPI000B3A971C|nr:CpsD/CapB family tyrosine-protein kinase [Lachnoclostridium sp. An76]OUN34466.1 tyrosine protein kinase [Lachnoclostridium sp. An76]